MIFFPVNINRYKNDNMILMTKKDQINSKNLFFSDIKLEIRRKDKK